MTRKWNKNLQPVAVEAQRAIHGLGQHAIDIDKRIDSASRGIELLKRWLVMAREDVRRQKALEKAERFTDAVARAVSNKNRVK